MIKLTRAVIIAGCIAVAATTWVIALGSKSTAEKQLDLINKADALMSDDIFILAVPLLEEAAGYDAAHTSTAEEMLKKAYLALIESRGFARKYTALLDKQIAGKDALPEVFAEAAGYYLKTNAVQQALTILKKGIEKTADEELIKMYEGARYAYETNRNTFDAVTSMYNQTIQVQMDGKWGVSNSEGSMLIPCQYDKTSTFHQNRAVVKKDGIVYTVDKGNNRIAVAPGGTQDFSNFADNRVAILSEYGWRRATSDFEMGDSIFEDFGMYCNGYAPANSAGKWGVIGLGSEWLIPAQYDEVIQDELGRCYGQGAVFVRSGGQVLLYLNGQLQEEIYQDARPFSDEGYAAVKRNGSWGFIDAEGNLVIDYRFDDALSFSGHLAAVKIDRMWGYVSIYGELAIDTVFFEAKSFDSGTAPVLTDRGWQLITLIEYKKEKLL